MIGSRVADADKVLNFLERILVRDNLKLCTQFTIYHSLYQFATTFRTTTPNTFAGPSGSRQDRSQSPENRGQRDRRMGQIRRLGNTTSGQEKAFGFTQVLRLTRFKDQLRFNFSGSP
jgi:hypothetical protein